MRPFIFLGDHAYGMPRLWSMGASARGLPGNIYVLPHGDSLVASFGLRTYERTTVDRSTKVFCSLVSISRFLRSFRSTEGENRI